MITKRITGFLSLLLALSHAARRLRPTTHCCASSRQNHLLLLKPKRLLL